MYVLRIVFLCLMGLGVHILTYSGTIALLAMILAMLVVGFHEVTEAIKSLRDPGTTDKLDKPLIRVV